MTYLLLTPMLLVCSLANTDGQIVGTFVRYETGYNYTVTSGGERFVQDVLAIATSAADSDLITGTNLWKITLYASANEDGSGQIQVFPNVQLTPKQASQSLQPSGALIFNVPVSLNMDQLEGFTHLCLKTEKNPAANPDFVFAYGGTDELNLCHSIDFNLPNIEYPESSSIEVHIPEVTVAEKQEPPTLIPEMSQRVEITTLDANMTFGQTTKADPYVLVKLFYTFAFGNSTYIRQGENFWQMMYFVSQYDDGTGDKRTISTVYEGYLSSTIKPNTELTFQAVQSFNFLEEYGPGQLYEFLCVTFTKHSQEDIDITFPNGESSTVCQRLPSSKLFFPHSVYTEIIFEENRTCHLWGDPHQKTFDGYGYTHQGDNEYIAVTTCNGDESVNDFEIVVDNFRRIPSKPVTYIREIRLHYNDVVYALTHPDDVSVDGVKVTLPYTDAENGVAIHYAAPHKILTTDFGLAIRFDNMHNSDVTLPVRYRNKVCGLCGNFDDDRRNECHYRNGTTMGVHNEECKLRHAKEWKYYTNKEIEYPEDFKPDLSPCEEGSDILNKAMELCDILNNTAGPLVSCYEHVKPGIYYNTCVYDLCQLLPETFFLCSSVETYISDCKRTSDEEIKIGDWRSVTGCEPPCKGNMTLNPHGSPCPPSCADPDGTRTSCSIPRLETCSCPEGKVLEGTKCVDPEECGCKMENGRYLSVGEEFVTKNCTEYCTCESLGNLQCRSMVCVENSQCLVKAGVRNCYCNDGYEGDGRAECNTTAGKVCHIYGDPHFHTFDDDKYSFQGDCTYVASKTCGNLPRGLTPFRLLIHNDALIPEERFTYLTQISLHFNGKSFKMRYTGEVSYDGQDIANALPFDDGSISVRLEGNYIVSIAVTYFGLKITYDGENDAEILLPPDYFGHVCGLCGNADGNSTNDKQKPDGTLAKKLDFANSWGIGSCTPLDEPVETCEVGTKEYERAVDVCSLLQDKSGPFAHCHDYKKPDKFVSTCIFDLCGTLPSTDLFCSSAHAYLRTCAEKGGSLDTDWKSKVKYCGAPTCAKGYDNFKQSCYKFVPTPRDFKSAKMICEREGAHLVTISSRAENEYVTKLSQGARSWMGAKRNKSARPLTYDLEANNVYTFLPYRLVRGIGSIRFSVKSHSDARLLLSSTKDIDDDTPAYEIALGADCNQRNFIRRCLTCEPKSENSKPSWLRKTHFRDYFVNFHEGNIQVGDMKKRHLILTFREPLPMRIRYVAFKSVAGSGSWKFYNNEFVWDTAEEWTYDNYRFGEPSNFEKGEHCLEINFFRNGLWNDHFCEEPKAFVCESDGV
ncbi:IgGFc-binding protein [Holothuria leucospilota]|uniref:IgGFc-binding protein n=1 Tax=Holothuria leucospilota TaxID=206669 RepID=A0A9Q1CD79_HOLLE|nr:IgGFc-binding protein [Holothuria leucospilota]